MDRILNPEEVGDVGFSIADCGFNVVKTNLHKNLEIIYPVSSH